MQHKVLVIENNQTSIAIMQRLIKEAKLQPICTHSLFEAKHVFLKSKPEEYLCAVVDFNLADALNGESIDFTIASFLPTIVVTENIDDNTREVILNKSIVDYIPKENAQAYEYLSRLLSRLDKNKKIAVLVVNKSRIQRKNIASLLKRHNFITLEASSSAESFELLNKHANVKLAIIDEDLSDKPAVQLISDLRQTHSKDDLGIIGITADKKSGLSARFIKSGATDYLHKSYSHEEFFCRVMQNIERLENIDTIRRVANSDYLTGLPNRRYFFSRVEAFQKVSLQNESLGIIDVDHFKNINDKYGHDCGDYTLKEIAKLVAEYFSDYTASRFGGEEFCVYFQNILKEEVISTMENFRIAMSNLKLRFEKQTLSCTVSIGLTHIAEGGINNMIRKADENLYKAKNNGRNRLVTD